MTYSDPFVPHIHMDGIKICAENADEMAGTADCVVIATDHSNFDYSNVLATSKLIVDTRNALKGVVSSKIVRL